MRLRMEFGAEGADVYRLIGRLNGHTYIYTYPPEKSEHMLEIIEEHVIDGKLPPMAGLILSRLVWEGTGDDDE